MISTYWKNKAILYRLDYENESNDNIVMSHNDFPYLKLKWPDDDVNFIEDGCYSHSGHYIATAARDDRIRIWDSKTGKLLHTFSFESWLRKNKMGNRIAYPESISFSPDDKYLVIGNYDGQIFILNSETGDIENAFFNNLKDSEKLPSFGHTAADVQSKDISCVRYTPDGDMVVFTSHDFYTHIINPKSADCALTLKGHLAPVYNLSFDRECKYIVTCSRDKTIRMWNNKGDLVKTLTGHSNEVYAAVCSPKEDIIISISGDRTMRIWNYKGQEIHEPISFEKTPLAICFSPNGEYIACSDETAIYVFETKTFQQIHKYLGHTFTITSVSFSPTGNQIMSTANDGTCRIWQFKPLAKFREDVIDRYNIIRLVTKEKQQLLFE